MIDIWSEARECSAFDRLQGFRDTPNFTGKMVSVQDGFWGIKIPGFFCPAGTYGMYAFFLSMASYTASILCGNSVISWFNSLLGFS